MGDREYDMYIHPRHDLVANEDVIISKGFACPQSTTLDLASIVLANEDLNFLG